MKIYSYNKNYRESTRFKVRSEAGEINVYDCDVSAYPFNRVWPGTQRSKEQTESTSFVMLGSNSEVTLEIEAMFDFEQVIVRPLNKKVKKEINKNICRLTFEASGQYSVEFDNMHKSLAVFINPEKSFAEYKNDNIVYFGAGVHIVDERIELEDNQTLFLDEGAVLYGSINATDKNNIKVVGYGIIDNSRMQRVDESGCALTSKDTVMMTGNPISFNRCRNVLIEGVTIVDSSGWNIYLDGCENILIDNIKLIGQWRYNADGCDFCNCTNGIIQNSFLRTFDDAITVKGFHLNNNLPVENILIRNCVLWCDWGRALEIGAETCAPYIRAVTFKNCDIIHGTNYMLDIQQGDSADIENIYFENINIEYSGNEMKPAIQKSDVEKYPFLSETYTPVCVAIKSGVTAWSKDDKSGNMRNIVFKDINILSDKNVFPKGSRIIIDNDYSTIDGVFFENIKLNGEKCNQFFEDMSISSGVSNVYFDNKKIV